MSDSQSNTAQLEARIAQLTDELKSTKDEVVVLRSAFAHLSSRLEAVESSKPAPSSARPKTAAPTPTKPAPEPKETKENGDAEKAVKRPMTSPAKKYPTLPKGTVITPVKKEAEPKKASDDSEVKKTPSKVLQARIPGSASKDRIVEEQEDIDPSRKGFYQVGKARVYYLLPEEYAGADEKKKAAVEPPTDLKLEFAYGYNGKAARHNLFFAKNKNDYVYSLAGTGVIYNPTDNTQKFMTAHSEDILCLAVHPTRDIVATGQLDPKGAGTPYILIWDSATAEVHRKILFHDKGIIAVAFSPDGKYLLSVGDDDNHTVAIWDWETAGTKGASAIPTGPKNKKENEKEMATPLLEQNLSKDKIFAVSFNPRPNAAAEESEDGKESKAEAGELEFVTLGPKHLKIWSVSGIDNKDKKARKLVGRTPSTREKTGKVQAAFLSVAFAPNGEYFVGTQSGNIFRMKGVNLVKVYDAHAKPADKQTEKEKDNEVLVGGIVRLNDGFASVADDAKVKLWDNDFKEIGEIDLSAHGTVRPKAMDFNGTDKIVIGTRNNTILEVNLETKQSAVRMEGHSDEVWALTVHPTDPIFVSGAHDKHLRFWNFQEHKVVEGKSVKLADKVRSAVFTPDGKHLVVGQNSGKAALYTYPALTQEWDKKIALETVDALAVSPDSTHVALGSWDQMIYIVSLPSGKIVHTLKGHTSSILMVNFSHDGKALMSNSRDYEILYWDVTKGKRITKQSEIADLKWSAWNCFLGWPVQGIWEGAGDGTDINAVDRSHAEAALATGDDFGRVRLYKYPAMQKDAPSKAYYGHSSHVTSVRFSPDDSKLFSAGGNDMALFQWRHEAAGAAGDQ